MFQRGIQMDDRKFVTGRTVADRFDILRTYVVVTTTGRSGSAFVADLVNKNAMNASAEHEPDLVPPDTSTQWYYDGADDKLADLAERKIHVCAEPRRSARCHWPSGTTPASLAASSSG